MIYMRTPQGTRVSVTVTRVREGTYDAEGEGAQFADVPLAITLEDEEGNTLTALDAYSLEHSAELSAFRARVEACGALDGARRAEERLEKLLDTLGNVPILSGAVALLRREEKDGE